jgi:hypothetical protein
MKNCALACLLLPIFCAGVCAGVGCINPGYLGYYTPFGDMMGGKLPENWKADATNPKGELAQWQIVPNKAPGAKGNILAITDVRDASASHFNLFWTKDFQLCNGSLSVSIRADSGKLDQGGGPIWRVMDANNYYVARYNPLEHNFRLYVVKDGVRKQLADAGSIQIEAGKWFTITVLVSGQKMECRLDGRKLLEATDNTFTKAGGIGLWTKADAASSFDGFSARPN